MYLAPKAKYDTKPNINAMAKIIDYDRVLSSLIGRGDITDWADDLWYSYSSLLEMHDKYNPGFSRMMQRPKSSVH